MKKILTGIVAFILMISGLVLVGLAILSLIASYVLFVMMTHYLIHNLWISIPIDICMLGVISSIMKMSRQYHTK
jgi:hypothetical protein